MSESTDSVADRGDPRFGVRIRNYLPTVFFDRFYSFTGFFFFFEILFIYLQRKGKGGRKRERNNEWLPLMHPLLGTCPATQICVLTGNRTGDPLVHRLALDPLNHTSQDHLFFVLIFLKYILLIMLLQLSHFPPSLLSALHTPSHPHFPPLVHVHRS